MADLPPLVLLHGFAGSPGLWDPVIDRLAPRRQILAPWLPGHGPAPAPSAGESFREAAAGMLTEIGREPGPPVRVIGYSLGARLAMAMLTIEPARFTGAVLIGARSGLASAEERDERATADAEWSRRLRADGIETFVGLWERLPLFASQRDLPAPVRERQRRQRLGHDPDRLADALDCLGPARMPDLTDALEQVRCPVTLVAGGLDPRFAAAARELAPRFADARVRIVSGCGHNVPLERPDAIAALCGA